MKATRNGGRESTDSPVDRGDSGWVLTMVISLSVIACAYLKNTERQTILGAGAGAVMGGAIGRTVGSITNGSVVGAIVGGAACAIFCNSVPAREGRVEAEIPVTKP